MKAITKYIFTGVVLLLPLTSCELDTYKPTPGPDTQVAYIAEFLNAPSMNMAIDDNGGKSYISPRLSGVADKQTTLKVEVAPEILKAYNEQNKTNFTALPEANFDFVVTEGASKVSETGSQVEVLLTSGNAQQKVEVVVHNMYEGGITPEQAAEQGTTATSLPTYLNYVIPIRLTQTSEGNVQGDASTGIIFLNRKFEAAAFYRSSGALTMVYKTEDPSFTDDPDFSSWTYQAFIRIDGSLNNFGLIYPNYRTRKEDWGYTCFYGWESPTFFMPEGKFGFNQKGFTENFRFKRHQWYHIAATFGPNDAGTNTYRFYLNGKLAFEQPTAGKSQGWQKAIIGNQGFRGWVRDWRLWNRELSAGEINETMWSVNPESEGLVMFLPLDKDFRNAIPGHEEDWKVLTKGSGFHFNDKFPFPMEMK